ncbi:MAG: ABC1 kinase family protein, partial [Reyranellales bacterium]
MADDAKDQEGDSLGGRLGRYAKVGASVGGLAAKLAGQRYLGFTLDRDKHAAELRSALGGLKGPLMKAAQLLATIPDALPPEYARELAQLQANAPAMGWAFVRRRMANELGPDWQSKFARFDKEASFAASLGQVHRAALADGSDAAAKLQYPDMASTLEADLNQLKLVFAVGQRFDPAIRTDEIHAEITTRLREELDYRREAKHVVLYRHVLRDEPNVHVPEVVPSHSTDRLLTMSWLQGEPLLNWKAHS